MIDYVYKLNLPLLTDVLLDSVKDKFFVGQGTKPVHKFYNVSDIIKPEWTKFNNSTFTSASYFYKNNYTGNIHIDDQKRLKTINEPCCWGINWIHGGHGHMEYWHAEGMNVSEPIVDINGYYHIHCYTKNPPARKYETVPGVYLVNASAPHRASGYNDRYALSMRIPEQEFTLTWNKVVEKFQNYIIPW